MKKDIVRDYAAAAFGYWARNGCPSCEEAAERVKKRAISRAKECEADPDRRLSYVNEVLASAAAGLADIKACDETFSRLESSGKAIICDAVRAVYMEEPWRRPKTREISGRVIRFAMRTPLSERQVWHYLWEARRLFAQVRGLRIGEAPLGEREAGDE